MPKKHPEGSGYDFIFFRDDGAAKWPSMIFLNLKSTHKIT